MGLKPSSTEVRIDEVGPHSADFDAVKALSIRYQAFLGALPWQAFSDAASTGRLVGAWVADELVGYTLFRFRRRDRSVSLTHVVVAEEWHRNGVARHMLDYIIERHPLASAITLKCREDYPASKLWPAVHFRRVGTTSGRGENGKTTLVTWVRDLGNTLFTFQAGASEYDDRVVVAIDSDVLRDIVEPRQEFRSSLALASDWVQDVAELVTVPNVQTEINKAIDAGQLRMGVAERFLQVRPEPTDVDRFRFALDSAPISSAIRGGDRRNLAQAAAGEADFFATRDRAILSGAMEIRKAIPIDVVSPADLLLSFHADANPGDYWQSSLVRTDIATSLASTVPTTAALAALVDHDTDEKARSLHRALERCAGGTASDGRVLTATDNDERLIAVLAERLTSDGRTLQVETIRTATGPDRHAITRHLIHLSRQHCIDEGSEWVAISGFTPEYVERALRDEGFKFEEGGWKARCDPRLLFGDGTLRDDGDGRAVRDLTPAEVSQIERERWPLMLLGARVPTYIVPIEPAWAQTLFDHDPPQSSLIQRDRHLGLSREHVYYRSKANFMSAPARLLWYVSQGRRDPNAGIRGWSWLESVITDRPGTLFARLGSRGVFSREDIQRCAGKSGEATALVFSRTMLFDRHLTLEQCRKIVPVLSTNGYLVTARVFDEQVFEKLYKAGMGIE